MTGNRKTKSSWRDKIFKRMGMALSLGTIAFVFEACYGIPPDREYQEELVSGTVLNSEGLPMSGVELLIDSTFKATTNEDGRFHSFVPLSKKHTIVIENKIDTVVSDQDASDLVLTLRSK